MNVLIFVVTMLMLLALMTYARLDSYRSSQVFQIIFNRYMETDERGYINLPAKKVYNSIQVTTKEGAKEGAKEGKKAAGIARIGILQLLNQSKRDEKPKEWLQTQILLKNLMMSLYKNQPFFKKALETNPVLVDELIAAITRAIDALPANQQSKEAKELANLTLPDSQLNQILYKVLQGAPCEESSLTNDKKKKNQSVKNENPTDKSQSEPSLENETDEFQSTEGYCSLLDFVSGESTPKVRIFVAPREVLNAIFHDPQVVDEIIAERQELYKLAIGDAKIEDLNTAFKDRFDRLKDSSIDSTSLSYEVSKTNPRDYK
ncbi:MAG: hypothetical protein WCF65_00350 [Parachlamydiaceae bacterium]